MLPKKRKVLTIVNSTLLVLAVCSVALILTQTYSPRIIDKFGVLVVDTWRGVQVGRFEEAKLELHQGDDSAAERLLNDWSDVGKGDFLFSYKRTLVLDAFEYWMSQNDLGRCLQVGGAMLHADRRDVEIFAAWATCSMSDPETAIAAKQKITEMKKRFPQNKVLLKLYATFVLDPSDLRAFIDEYAVRGFERAGWMVYGDFGEGYSEKWRKPVEPLDSEGLTVIALNVPSNLKSIRLDPPGGTYMKLWNFSLAIGDVVEPLPASDFFAPHMVTMQKGEIVVSGGNDPFFSIPVGKLHSRLVSAKNFLISIRFQAEPLPPSWLLEMYQEEAGSER